MVVIHVKRTEVDQFLFEARCADSNNDVIRNLVRSLQGRQQHGQLLISKRHRV